MCLKFLSGPLPISPGRTLEDAEGSYAAYSVAHPVASFAEEYYSGDPGRISRPAYIIYDEERQVFF